MPTSTLPVRPHRRLILAALTIGLVLAAHTGVVASTAGVMFRSTYQGRSLTVNPDQSIQAAIDAAAPGDTILLEDGVFFQQIKVNKPLIIRARNPGRATISGASNAALTFKLVDGWTDLFRAAVPWNVQWVMQGDRNLLNYRNLNSLKTFTYAVSRRVHAPYPGPHEGFAWEDGWLYVRLPDQANPNREHIEISRDTSGTAIMVVADDVVIEGLRIHIWYSRGIELRPGIRRTAVRNCYFDGTFTGIFGIPPQLNEQTTKEPAPETLLVVNNEFGGNPVTELRTRDRSNRNWLALYDSNLRFIFLQVNMHAVTVRSNYVYDVWDAIQIKGTDYPAPSESVISYNVIYKANDNPLEFDTDDWLMRARAHHNVAVDSFTYLSSAPFYSGGKGKLLADHNIFYSSPENRLPKTVWTKTCWFDEEDQGKVQRGLIFVHNTVVLGDSSLQSEIKLLTSCNSERSYFAASRIRNNIIWVRDPNPWLLPGFEFADENLVYGAKWTSTDLPTTLHAPPGFVSLSPKIDFHLRPDSSAINQGFTNDAAYHHVTLGAGTDLGAIEYGQTWNFPRPGPRWATTATMPQRPALPATLDPSWVGLRPMP